MTDHVGRMRTNKQNFDRKAESIRNHPDRVKQRHRSEVYEVTTTEHAEEQSEEIGRLAQKGSPRC